MNLEGNYVLNGLFKLDEPKSGHLLWLRSTLYFHWAFNYGNKMSVEILQAFDETLEDVESYFERIEAFFTANAVEAAYQVSTLKTVLGPKVYEKLRTACRPQRPSDKTFQQCNDIMIARYRRPNLVLAERIRLRKREQRQGETIVQFASDLRHITNSCGFTEAEAAAEI
jgi:Asp-tRNA(Asn)/Glu-tRNA(Gln) amidotransferase C subunit